MPDVIYGIYVIYDVYDMYGALTPYECMSIWVSTDALVPQEAANHCKSLTELFLGIKL